MKKHKKWCVSAFPMRNFLKIILFENSRKVGFALWLFKISTVLCIFDKINSTDWLTTMFLCSALIGGGTIADTYLKRKSGDPGISSK